MLIRLKQWYFVNKTTTFNFNNIVLKNVQDMVYLGFNVSYNGSIQSIMSNRILKAKKVAGMVLNALRTNKNISTKLALSIYDKQIAPVLMYGCAIWSVPRTGNLLYLENQPENTKATRKIVNDIFVKIFGSTIPIEYAKRVGKVTIGGHRRILIKVNSFDDKLKILASDNHDSVFSNYKDNVISDSEKSYLNFCKSSINMSKYASNAATCFELGIKPIDNKMHGLSIKYWLRLEQGTSNFLLNESYKESKNSNFEWTQGIQAMLINNGLGNVWNSPLSVNPLNFHKTFKNRLDDQFIQTLRDKIKNTTRFEILKTVFNVESEFRVQRYITLIRNPTVREIFTRLRIDMNILENSKPNIDKSPSGGRCIHCLSQAQETPYHMLFVCDKFSDIRQNAYLYIKNKDPMFDYLSMTQGELIRYVLDLNCPEDCISRCCRVVKDIYEARLGLNEEYES